MTDALKRDTKESMNTTQRIKALFGARGLKVGAVAEKFGLTRVSFSRRLNSGNFTEAELQKIAKIAGVKYEVFFLFPDGTKI